MAGRPRRFTPPTSMDHLPLDQPLDTLSPSVRALLEAGRRILEERGFRGLTLEAVANEAGASKSTLIAHFGSRAGYLATLFDSLLQPESVELVQTLQDLDEHDADVARFVVAFGVLYTDAGATREYFEIASNAMRDAVLRKRLAELFAWYRQLRAEAMRRFAGTDVLSEGELADLATLLNAAEDGLSFQRSMDESLDHQRVLDLLGHLVALYLDEKAASGDA